MRNAKDFPTRPSLTAGCALLAWGLLASAAPSAAHELKDISLVTAAGQTQLKLTFAPQGSEGDFPLYAQKSDPTKGTLSLSFLETETALPLGRHPLDAKAPQIEEVQLKKVTSPSGKNLLGLELKFRQAPLGDAVVEPAPKGVLKVILGKDKAKYAWSLATASKAGDAYLSAKAEAPPATAVGAKVDKLEKAAKTANTSNTGKGQGAADTLHAQPVTPAVPDEPGIPGAETPAVAEAEAPAKAVKAGKAENADPMEKAAKPAEAAAPKIPPAMLTEVKLVTTSSQANLILVLDPPSPPNYQPKKNAKDSSWLEVALDNAASGLAKKDYLPPKNPVYKRIKTLAKGSQLILRVQLEPDQAVQVAPHENGLVLSAAISGPKAPAFKWTSLHPEAKESESVAETEEPVKSALEEGAALDASLSASAGGKGLSSSKIFSVGMSAKAMVLMKDSAALKSAPGPKGTLIRKIPIGEKLVRLDNQAGNLRVVSGSDTGYIKAGDAVYEDELTKAQEQTIKGRIEAKQAMLDAALAKAAAAEAKAAALKLKEEEKAAALKAKQDEKARKAEELALKKAADKAAADSAKAVAKAKADSIKAHALFAADSAKAFAKAQALEKAHAKAAADSAKALAKAQAAEQQLLQQAPAPSVAGAPKTAGQDPAKPQPGEANAAAQPGGAMPKLAIADNPELAAKLAQEKLQAEEEKKRIEPEENRISYNSYGRRDPFIPVEQGSIDNGIDIDQMKVVGIIWQSQQPMAVLEHNREAGVSFTIKEGDPVHNGRVARITRDAVTFDISEYGISRSYSLKLVSSKEGAKQ